jgi:hypothetical protein
MHSGRDLGEVKNFLNYLPHLPHLGDLTHQVPAMAPALGGTNIDKSPTYPLVPCPHPMRGGDLVPQWHRTIKLYDICYSSIIIICHL